MHNSLTDLGDEKPIKVPEDQRTEHLLRFTEGTIKKHYSVSTGTSKKKENDRPKTL